LLVTEIEREVPRIDFRSLFRVFYFDGPIRIQYHYGTRTTNDRDWADGQLALHLLGTIRGSSAIPLDIFSLVTATGISHPPQCPEFLTFASFLTVSVPRRHLEWKASILRVFGSMMRAAFAGNRLPALYATIFECIHPCEDVVSAELKQKIVLPETFEELQKSFDFRLGINPESPLLALTWSVVERATKTEANFGRDFEDSRKAEASQLGHVAEIARQSSTIQYDLAIDQFATVKREARLNATKAYLTLFQSLSSDNGSWSSPEVVVKPHFKLQNQIFMRFIRLRMKSNISFQDHRDASLTRDLGLIDNTRAIYQKELSKTKVQEFRGDFAFVNLSDEDLKSDQELNITDVRLKCDAQIIAPNGIRNALLSLTKEKIFVDDETRVIRIRLSDISKVYFRRYLLVDSALEIFMKTCKAGFLNFNKDQRQTFLAKLLTQKLPNLKFCQRRADDVKSLALRANVKWQRGKLSNFDYLRYCRGFLASMRARELTCRIRRSIATSPSPSAH
jgi:hypothetical protein